MKYIFILLLLVLCACHTKTKQEIENEKLDSFVKHMVDSTIKANIIIDTVYDGNTIKITVRSKNEVRK